MSILLCHHPAVRGITLRLRIERCMGETDVDFAVLVSGRVVYEERDPHIEGMAFSADGRWLYLQRGYGHDRDCSTLDLRTGERAPEVLHPSDPNAVVLAADFISGSRRLGGVGDGRFGGAQFELSHPARVAAAEMGDEQRSEALERVLRHEPSPEAWNELTGLFDRWTGEAAEGAAAMAAERLAGWPEHLRRKPSWLSWIAPHPLWQLVTNPEQRLEAHACPLDAAALGRVLALPAARQLDCVELDRCGIDDEGARVIAGAPAVHRLRVLDLFGNPISDEGARAISESPWLGRLESLSLIHTRVSRELCVVLRNAPALASLQKLYGHGDPFVRGNARPVPPRVRHTPPVRPEEPHVCSPAIEHALSSGAVNAFDAWGKPPLFRAVAPFGGCERCTRRLLAAGADVNLRATNGESVVDALRAGVNSAAEHETANRVEAILRAAGFLDPL